MPRKYLFVLEFLANEFIIDIDVSLIPKIADGLGCWKNGELRLRGKLD